MSKNQTSIEWLINELQEKFTRQINDIYNSNQLLLEDVIIKAKAMHKEELWQVFQAGQDSMEEGGKGFEQYYTNIYEK